MVAMQAKIAWRLSINARGNDVCKVKVNAALRLRFI